MTIDTGFRIIPSMTKFNDKDSLFSQSEQAQIDANAPLAVRMRPKTLEDFFGQTHIVGPNRLLNRMLNAKTVTSLIFFGPPGVGKTTLARIVANYANAKMQYLSAPAASVKDIREIIAKAKDRLILNKGKTVLFIDEIHRFNRAQQDVLLDDVERGVIILIGATTENPYFSVNSPLISRSTVFQFEPLKPQDLKDLINRALSDKERGFGNFNIQIATDALEFWSVICDGDARRVLNALEVAVLSQQPSKDKNINITLEIAKESVQKKSLNYDPSGDTHYDLASAFQKSMRGSDPQATVYWLARMIAGGEDPRFIARRIAVCAAEDVGNADPVATMLAASATQISEFIGFPEAQLPLAQAAIYIACAPKSNASASAIWNALSDVKNGLTIPVPSHLKDAHYAGAKKLGHGLGYKYPHDYSNSFVAQDYLGVKIDKKYYDPTENGREKNIKQYLQMLESFKKNSKIDDKPQGT